MHHQLSTLEFGGKPIRVLEGGGVTHTPRLTPINDVADALGRDRRGVTRLVERDLVLQEMAGMVITSTPTGGTQETRCLPYEGVILLVAKMNAARSATKEAREFLIAFQRWAAETLRAVMMGEVPRPIQHRKGGRIPAAVQMDRLIQLHGFEGTREILRRDNPYLFEGLPGQMPIGPEPAVQPALGLVEPCSFRIRLEASK